MGLKIELPRAAARVISELRFPNRSVAVFVNGGLLCPDHPDDSGDYSLSGSQIELKGLRPDDLLTITDFRTFRWTYQDNKWYEF